MKFLLLIPSFLFLTLYYVNAQEVKTEFQNVKVTEKTKETSFAVVGFDNEADKKSFYNEIIGLPGVIYFEINNNNNCKLSFYNYENITADQIRKIIQKYNSDYKDGSVKYVERSINENAFLSMPKKINTGNPEKDDLKYQQKLSEWAKDNPEEWKQYLESKKNK